MSFLSDIAELAKAGYKPQDVKDLLNLSKPQENLKTEVQPAAGKTPPAGGQPATGETPPGGTGDSKNITEPDKGAASAPKASEQPDPEPDYKALYEAEQEKVKALQIKNNNADVSQNITVKEEDLLEAIKSFC